MRIRHASRAKAATALVAGVTIAAGIGLAGTAVADVEPEDSPAAKEAHAAPAVPGTPCSITTRACVDLESQRAWLIRDGKVTTGPVRVATGGADRETPVGHSFRVYRKDKDHVSGEFNAPSGGPAPMPFSIFFADGGVAFHGGDRNESSAGCVKLDIKDAETWFNDLQNGDQVQVVEGSKEDAARKTATR